MAKSKAKYGVIRSGKHQYAYHEVDLNKDVRILVQQGVRGWYAYKWSNPPQGVVELVGIEWTHEAGALEWLKSLIK